MYRRFAVMLLGLTTAAAPQNKELAGAAKKIESTWELAAAVHDGAMASADSNKGYRLVVSGGRYENRREGKTTDGGTLKFVGCKGDVLHLDLSPGEGVVLRMIAEWVDRDTLRVSGPAEPGGERPTKFTGEKGSKQVLITFRRVKS